MHKAIILSFHSIKNRLRLPLLFHPLSVNEPLIYRRAVQLCCLYCIFTWICASTAATVVKQFAFEMQLFPLTLFELLCVCMMNPFEFFFPISSEFRAKYDAYLIHFSLSFIGTIANKVIAQYKKNSWKNCKNGNIPFEK